MAIRRVVVAGNRTTFRNKEMCHEEIHRRSRVDLADRDPVAHGDCKRGPRVPVELLVREQRLLTISRQAGVSVRGLAFERAAGLHARVGRPLATRSILPIKRLCSPRCLSMSLITGAVGCTNEGKSGQSKARQIKSRCPGIIT